MNDMRRKLLAYYNSLNQDDMKPCLVEIKGKWTTSGGTGWKEESRTIYCDDPMPATIKECVKFRNEHAICYYIERRWYRSEYDNGYNTGVYASPTGCSYTYNSTLPGSFESTFLNANKVNFTGSIYDWNT